MAKISIQFIDLFIKIFSRDEEYAYSVEIFRMLSMIFLEIFDSIYN
jgi:hypothetical protein